MRCTGAARYLDAATSILEGAFVDHNVEPTNKGLGPTSMPDVDAVHLACIVGGWEVVCSRDATSVGVACATSRCLVVLSGGTSLNRRCSSKQHHQHANRQCLCEGLHIPEVFLWLFNKSLNMTGCCSMYRLFGFLGVSSVHCIIKSNRALWRHFLRIRLLLSSTECHSAGCSQQGTGKDEQPHCHVRLF